MEEGVHIRYRYFRCLKRFLSNNIWHIWREVQITQEGIIIGDAQRMHNAPGILPLCQAALIFVFFLPIFLSCILFPLPSFFFLASWFLFHISYFRSFKFLFYYLIFKTSVLFLIFSFSYIEEISQKRIVHRNGFLG